MRRAHVHAVRVAPRETSWDPSTYLSRFVAITESLAPLCAGLRHKVLQFFRHVRAVGPPIVQSEKDRARQHINGSQFDGQLEIEVLAEEIASLARHIERQKKQTAIAVEEASLAFHFRKTREQVVEALILLECQGRAKRIVPEGRRVFLF
jgi:hypothetical protein